MSTYKNLFKNPELFNKLMNFISFLTIKGFPCPFCRCNEVNIEKYSQDYGGYNTSSYAVNIKCFCKSCRRVENHIIVIFNKNNSNIPPLFINNRTILQVGEDIYLDMEKNKKYKLYDTKHRYEFEVEPFMVNYLELDKIAEKIEIMATFS